jgi:hypothetical protein
MKQDDKPPNHRSQANCGFAPELKTRHKPGKGISELPCRQTSARVGDKQCPSAKPSPRKEKGGIEMPPEIYDSVQTRNKTRLRD